MCSDVGHIVHYYGKCFGLHSHTVLVCSDGDEDMDNHHHFIYLYQEK